jgi:hypothetical protein
MREPRWDDYASYVSSGDEWYDVLWRRVKTVDSFWRGTATSPVEFSTLLRSNKVLKYGSSPKGTPRPVVVEAYESIVKFMLAWIEQYHGELVDLRRRLPRVADESREHRRIAEIAQERADQLEKELTALRWALQLAHEEKERSE